MLRTMFIQNLIQGEVASPELLCRLPFNVQNRFTRIFP